LVERTLPARAFLFLQGPSSPFFARIADHLEAHGHRAYRINLCLGDVLFWSRAGATSYRGSLEDWPDFLHRFMDQKGITDLILLGEQREHHKAAIAAAKARGIQVVVTDFGYLRPDWIILERDGMSAHSRFPRSPEDILALAETCPETRLDKRFEDSFWGMAMAEMLYHLSSYFLWFLFPHYRSFKVENPVLAYLGTGWRLLCKPWRQARVEKVLADMKQSDAPYFVFPLQMENDFQIRAYSHYPDMEAPIAEVIVSFARHASPEARLLVKIHPWDPGLRNWAGIVKRLAESHGVGDRVHYLDGGNLNAMIEHARGMVTINSTSGLQALIMNCPVITLGEAIYDVPGLSFQGALDEYWSSASPPDPKLRDAYIKAMAATLQIRGVFYRQPGLNAAVSEATNRLSRDLVNKPMVT
jgi:capsular polysaccharide export protein